LACWLDRFFARPMFCLSIVYLAIAAGVIHRLDDIRRFRDPPATINDPPAAADDGTPSTDEDDEAFTEFLAYFTNVERSLMLWGLLALTPIFFTEAWLRFFLTRGQMSLRSRLGILAAVHLAPFLRIGLRSHADATKMWLPWLGWQTVDRALRRRLERFFSVPLIIFALLVLPVLGIEHFAEEEVHHHFWLKLALDVANSLIWMAFAIEFTLSVSVAENKLYYCVQNWIDLAVVALPVLDFLPVLRLLRLARLARLNQLSRLGRLYRLRGLLLKAWRAFLLLEMISRLLGNYKERRLKKVCDLIAAKEIELEELRQEKDELQAAIQKEKDAASPSPPVPERETVE
jgi:hypothetical protein